MDEKVFYSRKHSLAYVRPPRAKTVGKAPQMKLWQYSCYGGSISLLCRGLLQSRWVETRGGWEEGKLKARGERSRLFPLPIVPRASVFSLAFLLPCFFFHWCLLTEASAEEREGSTESHNNDPCYLLAF